jgi:hypothetical protein
LRYSRNGVLNTTLRASVSGVRINHKRVVTMNYEGSFPGPALVRCDGDKLVVHLINHLDQPTNLHTHGLHGARAKLQGIRVWVINGATCNAADKSGCGHIAAKTKVGLEPTDVKVNDGHQRRLRTQ